MHRHGSAEPDGTPCYYDVYRLHPELPENVLDGYTGIGMLVVLEFPDGWWSDATDLLGHSPRECVGSPGPEPSPVPTEITPAVEELVLAVLPEPAVAMDPGEVITGLPAYLDAQWEDEPAPVDSDCEEAADAPPHRVVDDDDPDCQTLPDDVRLHVADLQVTIRGHTLDITLDAIGRYTVDWGDGSSDEYTIEGLPYPDGQVRHTYQSVPPEREVTLTIQEYWTAQWTVVDIGTFPVPGEVAPPPTALTVPISEVQAVVH